MKNVVSIMAVFDLLLEAQDHAQKYPSSRADDASTDKIVVQYVLTRV